MGRRDVVIVGPEEDLRWVWNVYERTELMDRIFPYAFRQGALRAGFRVRTGGCAVRSPSQRHSHAAIGSGGFVSGLLDEEIGDEIEGVELRVEGPAKVCSVAFAPIRGKVPNIAPAVHLDHE
jgi:hypothetical protein